MRVDLPEDPTALRPMREADLEAVMGIEEAAYRFGWSRGIFADCLRVGYSCWVLEEARRVEAYGIMSTGAGEAHILNICVRPQRQRQGLGRRMLEHLIVVARRHRTDTVFLEVRPSNKGAIRLYDDMGFNQVGLRRNYYPAANGREDALIFARTL